MRGKGREAEGGGEGEEGEEGWDASAVGESRVVVTWVSAASETVCVQTLESEDEWRTASVHAPIA
eukprot:2917214-Rhodomonas_salina.1